MNQDMIGLFLKQAVAKALASGGTAFLEELADSLPTESLGKFIEILKKVYIKKKSTIG